MTNHLVIPDCHVAPGVPNDRLELAGIFALDRRPDTVVCLGDFVDMPSLCSYDKGKKIFEGRRYSEDILAARDALSRFDRPIRTYNEMRKRNGKAQYKPRKVMLLGNHEDRIDRAIQAAPHQLENIISIDDLGYKEWGWEVIPYLKPIKIDDIFYCHYMISGVKGEAISGFNIASNILAKHMASCTVGHIHLFDHSVRSAPDGRRFHGLSAGCFIDDYTKLEYADPMSYLWWSGLTMCNDITQGDYDLEQISLKRLKRIYGA